MKTIEIISIPVSDQEKAKAFYQLLGFEVVIEASFQGDKKWVQMGLPGDTPSITLVNWFDSMIAGSLRGLVLKTDDIELEVKELNEKGVETSAIDKTPWGRFFSVKDPDGNSISFRQGR